MNKKHIYDFRHIFFDFDGTICASEPDIKNGWLKVMQEMKLCNPEFDKLFQVGPALPDMAKKLFPALSQEIRDEIVTCFKKLYDMSDFPNTLPYPWIDKWLADLKNRGCELYIVTNKRKHPTNFLVKKFRWDKIFTGIYSPDSFPAETLNKSQLLAKAMDIHAACKQHAVMVGDTNGDIIAGKNNGIATVGVTWGYGAQDELVQAQCDILLSEKDFEQWL